MKFQSILFNTIATVMIAAFSTSAMSQSGKFENRGSNEDKLNEVFVMAGYGTAFGAATGAALLSFYDQPRDRLHFVAVGASIGFLAGSVIGSYVTFAPSIRRSGDSEGYGLLEAMPQGSKIALQPIMNADSGNIDAFAAGIRMFEF